MGRSDIPLSRGELRALRCPVSCHKVGYRIGTVPEFLSVVSSVLVRPGTFWFRGHKNSRWDLIPTALRYTNLHERDRALCLINDFVRVAEIKLSRPPDSSETLKWMQLAQHYGIPTRLLDWTESALFALYFACERPPASEFEYDGMVFLLNPESLFPARLRQGNNRGTESSPSNALIQKYLRLGGKTNGRGLRTIAVKPVWNSERLMMQRGAFTLHGSRSFGLDATQAPSLLGIPILSEAKRRIRMELQRLAIDEMTIFPELEHAGSCLKGAADLE